MAGISRRRLLVNALRSGGLLGTAALAAACSVPAVPSPSTLESTPAPTPEPTAVPQPTLLPREAMALRSVAEVEMVAKEAGEDSINDTAARYNIYGTDLGHMFDKDGKVYMVFGDTFGCCIPGTGGPGNAADWRSNTMAVLSDRDPIDGLLFDSMIVDRPGHAAQLLAPGRFDKTVIPTYGVAVGERMFLHYMAVLAWGDPGEWFLNESGLAYSDDDGQTWAKDENVKWPGDSNFGQSAIVKHGGDLLFFGIPGGRSGGVKLASVPQEQILDLGAYRYFAGLADYAPQWQSIEQATTIVPAPVGELSVIWNDYLERWIMTYLDESRASLVIREAAEPWGPWSAALPLVSGTAYPGLYGAYMHPWYVENGGEVIYFTMSLWEPYSVFLMRARLARL